MSDTRQRQATCRNCGEEILWTTTRRGKRMPVDPEPVTRATAGPDTLLFTLEGETEKDAPVAVLSRKPHGYIAHWITCPKKEER